ncbi:MAG TPA: cytochrome P450 [Acidimicrobiales bacterium]|nr:cytochrome P450 [Acidimicrobiales bacterium]
MTRAGGIVELKQTVMNRVVVPATLRYFRWRGDPLAGLMTAETRADPYPLWDEIRARGDLFHSRLGMWATADHAAATAILRDQRFSSSPVHQKGYRPPTYPEGDPRSGMPGPDSLLLTMDPPDHTRIRRLVASTFSPPAIAALEPWVRQRTDALLGGLDPTAGFDLIEDLALPLPIAVICHLLGVPEEDMDRFRAWGHAAATGLEPQVAPDQDPAVVAAEVELMAYLRDLIDKRRAKSDDSLLSALIAAEEQGERLSNDELLATADLLLIAGFETTVNLIGNGTAALIGAPDQWQLLRQDPDLLPNAVEELLRYDSPVQATSRVATEEIAVGGISLPRSAQVIIALGGANRDPAEFVEPGRLNVTRSNAGRHLSFSQGIHHCLGAALARLEGRVAIGALTERFGRLMLAGPPVRRPLLGLRGYERLPVRCVAGG